MVNHPDDRDNPQKLSVVVRKWMLIAHKSTSAQVVSSISWERIAERARNPFYSVTTNVWQERIVTIIYT